LLIVAFGSVESFVKIPRPHHSHCQPRRTQSRLAAARCVAAHRPGVRGGSRHHRQRDLADIAGHGQLGVIAVIFTFRNYSLQKDLEQAESEAEEAAGLTSGRGGRSA